MGGADSAVKLRKNIHEVLHRHDQCFFGVRKCLVEGVQRAQVTFRGPLRGDLNGNGSAAGINHEVHFSRGAPPIENVPAALPQLNESGNLQRLAQVAANTSHGDSPQRRTPWITTAVRFDSDSGNLRLRRIACGGGRSQKLQVEAMSRRSLSSILSILLYRTIIVEFNQQNGNCPSDLAVVR